MVKIHGVFLGFVSINDSTGKGLATKIIDELKKRKLKILYCRGHGYDNGANMKGKDYGVQKDRKKIWTLFYVKNFFKIVPTT